MISDEIMTRLRFLLIPIVMSIGAAAWAVGAPAIRRARLARTNQERARHYRDDVSAFGVLASAALEREAASLVDQAEPAIARAHSLLAAGNPRGALDALNPLRVRLRALVDENLIARPDAAAAALLCLDAAFDEAQRGTLK